MRFSRHGVFRFMFAVLAAGCVATTAPAQTEEFEKNILTGSPSGTYIQFGRDIAGLAAACDRTLNVRESAGSLENFIGVRQRPRTQFGIVQSDVLEYLRTFATDDPAIARAILGVRIAFPLYDEEIHLIAQREIEALSDLQGKRVAIGVEDSGTFLTASLVLDLAAVEPAERLTVGPDAALEGLVAGDIDAFFYVAGAPAKLFEDPRLTPQRHHLLPIDDPVLESVYLGTTIPANTYSFQPEEVPAIAVKAVLMTYEYNPNRNAYHRESCRAVSEITHLILTRFDQLQESGHPKWKQTDLNDIPPNWEIGGCVNAGLSETFAMNCGSEEQAAPPPTSDSEANRAYRERICAAIGC